MIAPAPRFYLYVSHPAGSTTRAVRVLEELVATYCGGRGEIDVIDVTADPERAELAGILVTPTIDNPLPLPGRRVVGAPDSVRQLAQSLGLFERLDDTRQGS